MPKDFTSVARQLCEGDPPQDMIDELARHAPFVSGPPERRTRQDFVEDVVLIIALEKVQDDPSIYLDPIFQDDLLDADTASDFESLSQSAYKVLEFLKSELRPLKGKQADGRRYMCAAVCDRIWTKVHGKPQRYSTKLYAAMEEYWLACHPKSGAVSGIDWRKVLTGH
jgi:hypothetical protein